jgi:ankyrin repeat protein
LFLEEEKMSSVGSAGAPDVRHLRLVQACASGNEAVVRELLDEAISPGGVHSSWTATGPARDALRHGLQRAAARGNVSIARLLLEAGAEVDARSGTSASGVIAFPAAGSATLGGIAVGGAGSGVAEIAAVFRAAENGHVAATRLLLDKAGARVDARDRLGRTPLFPAALRGYVEVVRLLIAAGADVDARDKEERTVLIVLAEEKEKKAGKAAAAVAWDRTVLRALLEAGANVEAADRQGRTALIWAADMAKAEMLQGLIDGVEGKTPANIEAYVFCRRVLRGLTETGARTAAARRSTLRRSAATRPSSTYCCGAARTRA